MAHVVKISSHPETRFKVTGAASGPGVVNPTRKAADSWAGLDADSQSWIRMPADALIEQTDRFHTEFDRLDGDGAGKDQLLALIARFRAGILDRPANQNIQAAPKRRSLFRRLLSGLFWLLYLGTVLGMNAVTAAVLGFFFAYPEPINLFPAVAALTLSLSALALLFSRRRRRQRGGTE